MGNKHSLLCLVFSPPEFLCVGRAPTWLWHFQVCDHHPHPEHAMPCSQHALEALCVWRAPTALLPPFLKNSVLFPAPRAKALQHRRNGPRFTFRCLHYLPLLKKRPEQETTMCLQSQSSHLPPCETHFRWFWWSAGQKRNGIPVHTSLPRDSYLPPAGVLQAHNGLRWARGQGKSSVTGQNILHFPLEQSRGGRSVVSVEPIRNLSLIRNNDPLTWSSNFQAPLAHAREAEMLRMSYLPHLQNAT